jgi:hypothetical protein
MSDVTVSLSVLVNKTPYQDNFTPNGGGVNFNQTTIGGHRPIVIVNSSAVEAVPFGDVVTPGLMYGRSLATTGSTAFISVGMSSATGSTGLREFGKISAGRTFQYELAAGVKGKLKWKAGTGTIKVDLRILET